MNALSLYKYFSSALPDLLTDQNSLFMSRKLPLFVINPNIKKEVKKYGY
jgi:hypothetical protein